MKVRTRYCMSRAVRGVGVVGNQQKEIVPGSMIYIPQGAWHGIRSIEEMKIIWIVSPPNFANYLREVARLE